MSLGRALVLLVVAVLLAGSVPVGLALDRRLAAALEEKAAADLALAPVLLADRLASSADMRMMHAKDVAATPALAAALLAGDTVEAARVTADAPRGALELPILVDSEGRSRLGPQPAATLVARARAGEMPVVVVAEPGSVRMVALAPVHAEGRFLGAAGVVSVLDATEAAALSGLTRADVVVLDGEGAPAASTLDAAGLDGLLDAARSVGGGETSRIERDGRRWLLASAPVADGAASVLFLRDLDRELAVVPDLRRVALASMAVALVVALLLGMLVAGRLAGPVRALARAADRVAAGDLDAPLARAGVSEVAHVADAFDVMRQRLAARLRDLERANRELEDRQERLVALQAELLQRDRREAAGRLLTQLAHEVRNPVASVRNCLELLRRRVQEDEEAREIADLAIDELLRMHELAERMMDLDRPRDDGAAECAPLEVCRHVARLAGTAADDADGLRVEVSGDETVRAAIGPDALKQVLLNLVRNAREAMRQGGRIDLRVEGMEDRVRVQVLDTGPGIDAEVLPRVFDPFFTTKADVRGVGLGLFTAEGLVRAVGGRVDATNRTDGPGARFDVELPRAGVAVEVA